MRAFITGVSGFAGRYLAQHLRECQDVVLGSTRSGAPGTLAWDIREPASANLRATLESFAPQWIFHLAALSVPQDCGASEPTAEAVRVNVEGTSHLLELVRQLPRPPRVLLVSSCEVYAPVSEPPFRVDESSRLGPHRAYGRTKLAAEEQLARARDEYQLDAIVARAFQHTGPGQSHRMMLPEWSRQIARGEKTVRVVTLDSHLDLSDVRDVVRAYRLLAERGESGSIYNVGSGRACRSGDVFDLLRSLYDPRLGVEETHPGPHQHPIADVGRLARDTGWSSQVPLEQTVRDTLDYWLREPLT